MNQFEAQQRVRSIEIPFDFHDNAPPAVLCKTASGFFTVSKTGSDMLMLMNDGCIASPLAMLRPVCAPSAVDSLKKARPAAPEWMRPKGSLDYCEFHRHCSAHAVHSYRNGTTCGIVIKRVPNNSVLSPQPPTLEFNATACASQCDVESSAQTDDASSLLSNAADSNVDLKLDLLTLSAKAVAPVPDPDSIVVLEISNVASPSGSESVFEECKNWLQLMKELSRKMMKKKMNPLPIFARGISLNGYLEPCSLLASQPAHIALSSEGFLHQQHVQLCSRSCAEPQGDFNIKLTNVLSASASPIWTTADSIITFKSVEHRDNCLRIVRHIIACIARKEKKAVLLLNSIEMQLQSKAPPEDGLLRSFLTILSPKESPMLGALDFPYEGPSPPIMEQLTRIIRCLYERCPEAILKEIEHQEFTYQRHSDDTLSKRSRPLHLLVRSCFDVDVRARSVYWLMSAVAHSAPTALRVKDCNTVFDVLGDECEEDNDHESHLLVTLIFSKRNSSLMRDHDFEVHTLRMLLQSEPSLASDFISDSQGETVFSLVCSNVETASCIFHRDACHALHALLQASPSLASQRIPSSFNRFPLHLLCLANPKPRELRLVLDAYPDAAASGDSDGSLPIHALVSVTSYVDCIDMLSAVAPDSMSVHSRQGYYPLHIIGQSRPCARVLASLIRNCQGRIVCDFAPKPCKSVLKQMMRWAAQGSTCEHYELIRSMKVLDISSCEDEMVLKATEFADMLSHLLPHCTSLTILDISDNHFSRELIENLLPVMLQLPKLQRLNLDGKPQMQHKSLRKKNI
jgi:hypothetical protein